MDEQVNDFGARGASKGDSNGRVTAGPSDAHLLALGRLHYLAAFCPLHKKFPQQALARLFLPAINHDSLRFFENNAGQVAAALIWARLSDEVSERMLFEQVPPQPQEWASGPNLWFLDILAPFGHGGVVARHIARNPPEGPFFFARLGKEGAMRKVVRGDATRKRGQRVQTYFIDQDAAQVA